MRTRTVADPIRTSRTNDNAVTSSTRHDRSASVNGTPTLRCSIMVSRVSCAASFNDHNPGLWRTIIGQFTDLQI